MRVKHVLCIATNTAVIGNFERTTGFFFPEIAHPFEELEGAGVAVEFASPLGGIVPHDGYDGSDPVQKKFLESAAFRRLQCSRKLSEVDVLDYDAIFFPGGLGPMVDISKDRYVKRAVLRAWNGGKIVSAVCHGPVAFLGVRFEDGTPFVKGRKLTSFSKAEEDGYAARDVDFDLEGVLREAGAEYTCVDPWQPHLIVDGRLITGQNPASGTIVGKAIADALAKVD
ncbi:type 1 glutamine amidotransferase domain-containing protein [Luteibacter pinisoli]|uniref:Type 1 glutamine amidotransferase domain-containing protein n=1 Tax=Luteibacter pinisoli TaxID=2589080 RepID=A0A4Y5Z4L7_9GAMM|nr:type 1 glutamine amidotransferase domain-containing protein [Luteibacter pinisoli]QDE39475.1 type 1 glutamine amidotransferase domain-containing protein [Luteibacter pinisoli]